MEVLGKHLRQRARQLGLSDAEVARRAGLSERRYGHYVTGTREPDLATLVNICAVLDVTPNQLLGIEKTAPFKGERGRLAARLSGALNALDTDDLRIAVRQVEVLAQHRSRKRQVAR